MKLRKPMTEIGLLITAALFAGCASTPATDTAETQAASAEPKVVQTSAQAEKYASEDEIKRAYRECMRKMRRITGSRIPRNSCQGSAGLYGGAYNQEQENSNRGSTPLD
jgi:hypothetical protein